MAKHRCFAAVCESMCAAEYLFCRRHWFAVPGDLRRRIWDTAHQAMGRGEYLAAVSEAIARLGERDGLEQEIVQLHTESLRMFGGSRERGG